MHNRATNKVCSTIRISLFAYQIWDSTVHSGSSFTEFQYFFLHQKFPSYLRFSLILFFFILFSSLLLLLLLSCTFHYLTQKGFRFMYELEAPFRFSALLFFFVFFDFSFLCMCTFFVVYILCLAYEKNQ